MLVSLHHITLQDISPQDVSGIKHEYIPGKGRGLVATEEFRGFIMIWTQQLLGFSPKRGKVTIVAEDANKSADEGADEDDHSKPETLLDCLSSQLFRLAYRDARVAHTLSVLDDNDPSAPAGSSSESDGKLKLAHLPDMVQHLSSLVLPLLPQLWEYFPQSERVFLSAERVRRVCSVNCFGPSHSSNEDEPSMDSPGYIQGICHFGLYPVAALMNHSTTPNVRIGMLLMEGEARRSLLGLQIYRSSPGDELTICYSSNATLLKEKWGIKPADA